MHDQPLEQGHEVLDEVLVPGPGHTLVVEREVIGLVGDGVGGGKLAHGGPVAAVEHGVGHADRPLRGTGVVRLLDLGQGREDGGETVTESLQAQIDLRPEPGDRVDREHGLHRFHAERFERP